jgi:16S rRNA C1402 N4-methylase RsmH
VSKGGITPSDAEIRRNRRARSARLRVAEKLAAAGAS